MSPIGIPYQQIPTVLVVAWLVSNLGLFLVVELQAWWEGRS